MSTVTVNELMKLEKSLLMLYTNHKFDLSFNDYLKIMRMLKEIGKVTDSFFLLQQEYYKANGDKDKLQEYHDRLINDKIEYNVEEIEGFLEKNKNLL